MDHEIDYKKMFEEQKNIFEEFRRMNAEFFDLMQYLTDNAHYMTPVTENIMKLELPDQILYLRSVKKSIMISKAIIEKYKLEVKEEPSDEG